MKEIVYNYDHLKDEDINRIVKRAKIVIENSKGELLMGCNDDNCHLLGGHVDEGENDNETLIRELKEEAGIDFNPHVDKPFVSIVYYNKNYPQEGINSKTIANYYYIKADLELHLDDLHLTKDEKKHHFKVLVVLKKDILNVLNEYLEKSVRKNVVKDTILVMKEYLKI